MSNATDAQSASGGSFNMGDYGQQAFGIAGSIYGANRANKARKREADYHRAWQEKMSNTAYQRAAADMRKAGFNPILALMKGGASTPSGGMANIQDEITPAVNTGISAAQMESNTSLNEAKKALTEVERDLKSKDAPLARTKESIMKHIEELYKHSENLIKQKKLPEGAPEVLKEIELATKTLMDLGEKKFNNFGADMWKRLKRIYGKDKTRGATGSWD